MGSSRFYVSLEDDLMRLFGADLVSGLMERIGWEEDLPIEHNYLSRAIERSQRRVEARNFDIRKHVLDYDDVMNQQREVIYGERRKVLGGLDVKTTIMDMLEKVVKKAVDIYANETLYPGEWDIEGLGAYIEELLHKKPDLQGNKAQDMTREELEEYIINYAGDSYLERETLLGADQMRQIERLVLLHVVDAKWMEHLYSMDNLREGIGLRAYGQRDPLVEYKLEAYELFQEMIEAIQEDVVRLIFKIRMTQESSAPVSTAKNVVMGGLPRPTVVPFSESDEAPSQEKVGTYVRSKRKVGRNEPCPCGSGKKYKKCCGKSL